MLDEASRVRLAEMGIDVYLPRAFARSGVDESSPAIAAPPVAAAQNAIAAPVAHASVLLLAESASKAASALLNDVVRALRFANISGAHIDAREESRFAEARGLILFGEALSRAVGATLTAQRQREIEWVVSGDPGVLARDAQAKRAWWSELKRLARALANAKTLPVDDRIASSPNA
jgi:hypothetical protein